MTTRVAIALGSNVGDRRGAIERAFARLREILSDVTTSTLIETDAAEGAAGQSQFINAAAVGNTSLSARELLDQLLEIERAQGRTRPFPMAPRTIDLDLILFGNETIDKDELTVPHPRFRDRGFVLEPLSEIAPDWVDPVTGKTVKTLLSEFRH